MNHHAPPWMMMSRPRKTATMRACKLWVRRERMRGGAGDVQDVRLPPRRPGGGVGRWVSWRTQTAMAWSSQWPLEPASGDAVPAAPAGALRRTEPGGRGGQALRVGMVRAERVT